MNFRFEKRRWLGNSCLTIPQIYCLKFKSASDVKWTVFNKPHVGKYSKVHHDKVSDVTILQVKSQEITFTPVLMQMWILDKLELEHIHNREIQ